MSKYQHLTSTLITKVVVSNILFIFTPILREMIQFDDHMFHQAGGFISPDGRVDGNLVRETQPTGLRGKDGYRSTVYQGSLNGTHFWGESNFPCIKCKLVIFFGGPISLVPSLKLT